MLRTKLSTSVALCERTLSRRASSTLRSNLRPSLRLTASTLPQRCRMSTTSFEIPAVQRAAVVTESGKIEMREDFPVTAQKDLKPGECLVKILSTGCCHTDLHAALNDWPLKAKKNLVGGHEGVGIVVAIGNATANSPVKLGDRVGIKWLADSCLNCEPCRQGREQNCDHAKLSGFSVDGTFSEYTVSFVNHVTPIPEGYPSDEAASILCAGVTTYRAIKYSETVPGDWIVLPGAGGGLGHLAVQYAKVRGLRVIAIDSGAEKKKLCEKLGADAWIDFMACKDVVAEVRRITGGPGAHAAVVTTASASGYTQAVDYLRSGGRLMAVGLPGEGALGASIFWTVYKSIKIIGSYVGNRQDAVEALDIASRGEVKVHFVSKDLHTLPNVYEDMKAGKVAGRIVFDMHKH